MVQILTPTRLAPSPLSLVTSNPFISGYNDQQNQDIRQHADQRAQQDQSYQNIDRQRADQERDALSAWLDKNIPPDGGSAAPTASPDTSNDQPTAMPAPALTPSADLSPTPQADPITPAPANNMPVQQFNQPPAVASSAAAPAPDAPDMTPAPMQTADASAPPIPNPQPWQAPKKLPPMDSGLVPDGGSLSAVNSAAPAPAVASPTPPQILSTSSGLGSINSGAPAAPGPAQFNSPVHSVKSPLQTVSSVDKGMARALATANPNRAAELYKTGLAGDKVESDKQDADELQVLQMAAAGNPQGAMALAKQKGITIDDPRILQNAKTAEAMYVTGTVAKQLGASHDQKWMTTFMGTYVKTGDIQQAVKSAGTPTAPIQPNRYSENAQGDVLDRGTGAIQRSVGTPRPVNGGAQAAQIQVMEYLQKTLKMTPQEAANWVQQSKSNPNSRNSQITTLASSLLRNDTSISSRARKAGISPLDLATKEATQAFNAIAGSGQAAQPLAPPALLAKPAGAPGAAAPSSRSLTAPAAAPIQPPAAQPDVQMQRAEGTATNRAGEEVDVYSEDGGKTWYNSDDDTPFDGDYEGE